MRVLGAGLFYFGFPLHSVRVSDSDIACLISIEGTAFRSARFSRVEEEIWEIYTICRPVWGGTHTTKDLGNSVDIVTARPSCSALVRYRRVSLETVEVSKSKMPTISLVLTTISCPRWRYTNYSSLQSPGRMIPPDTSNTSPWVNRITGDGSQQVTNTCPVPA